MNNTADTLAARINATVHDFISGLPDNEKQTVGESFATLQASDVAANAVNTGDTAPDFTLLNATGQHVNLHGPLSRGPVILSFYRGGWCPFCNLELQALPRE